MGDVLHALRQGLRCFAQAGGKLEFQKEHKPAFLFVWSHVPSRSGSIIVIHLGSSAAGHFQALLNTQGWWLCGDIMTLMKLYRL